MRFSSSPSIGSREVLNLGDVHAADAAMRGPARDQAHQTHEGNARGMHVILALDGADHAVKPLPPFEASTTAAGTEHDTKNYGNQPETLHWSPPFLSLSSTCRHPCRAVLVARLPVAQRAQAGDAIQLAELIHADRPQDEHDRQLLRLGGQNEHAVRLAVDQLHHDVGGLAGLALAFAHHRRPLGGLKVLAQRVDLSIEYWPSLSNS